MIERFICTKKTPWTVDKGSWVFHVDAISDGECSTGCCDYYKCPNCEHRWKIEVAD